MAEDRIARTSPDGVRISVGIGLLDGKRAVTMFIRDAEEDEISCSVPPRMAWRLAVDLIGKTISAKMPPHVVRSYRIMRGKNV